ncbi:hypothetical protein [Micromonospora chersina]|uniref:hypothetical protein n=1 Tax=Micromonospora chersina TaxID=47854 RepID=UPI0033B12C4B
MVHLLTRPTTRGFLAYACWRGHPAEADRAVAQALHDAVRADQKKAKKTTGGGKDKGGKKAGGKKGKKRSADQDEARGEQG